MSKELAELRLLARAERHRAWTHAKMVPARIGDTASAFARCHPILAMGGAAALAMGFVSRRRGHAGVEGAPASGPLALAAMGVQFMPEILKLVGLTVPAPKESLDEES